MRGLLFIIVQITQRMIILRGQIHLLLEKMCVRKWDNPQALVKQRVKHIGSQVRGLDFRLFIDIWISLSLVINERNKWVQSHEMDR